MKRELCAPDTTWYCEIILEPHEWGLPLDDQGVWMNRPIRRWVYENCHSGVFFAAAGWILFEREADAVAFMLTWS